MMGDLKDMKDDHVQRMATLQKAYEGLLRRNHQIASEMLDKARQKAGERIKMYKDKAIEINKQLMSEKKAMEKQQRSTDKEMKAMKRDVDAIIRAKKDISKELASREKKLSQKHEEVRVLQARLSEYEGKYSDVDGTVAKLEDELASVKAEAGSLGGELQAKVEEAASLEDALKSAEAELVKLKAGNVAVSSVEMQGLVQELDEARATIPMLEAEKEALTAEIARLSGGGAVAGVAAVDGAQVELLKGKLEDVDKARRAELERFRGATAELEARAEAEKEAALAAQQELYDTMIKQMLRAGKTKEEQKQRKALDSIADERLVKAQREADEAARKKAQADARKDEVDGKCSALSDRLAELEAELARKKAREQEVAPEHAELAAAVQQQEAAAADAQGHRARAAQYTAEEGRAQLAKFNLDWDQVNGPVVAQLLDVCKNYNLMKALQEDMRGIKAQHEEAKALSGSPDLDVSGPAKIRAKELAGQFNALKGDATTHKAQWHNQVQELGLKDAGVGFTSDEDFEQLALAAEMWHEVMRKDPSARNTGAIRGAKGAVIPANLAGVMKEFQLDPTATDAATVAALEAIVGDYTAQRAKQEELKDVKADFDAKKAGVKDKEDEATKAKQALAEAKAEGKPAEEVDALQAQVEALGKESVALKKEAKALMDRFNALKPEAKALQEQWRAAVAERGLVSPQHPFESVADFELLTYIADEWRAWQDAEGAESGPRDIGDDELPSGPSEEMRAKVAALEQEKAALGGDIGALEGERAALLKEKEEYEDMQQMAALATLAANKEANKAKQAYKKVEAEARAEAGEDPVDGDDDEAEQDLTGGNAILINEDVAEAHKELLEAKFALAQAQKQAEVFRGQIHEERKKHQGELEELEARIKELEAEIEAWKRKEVQWKVSAGTFYAKAGIAGVQSQNAVGQEFKSEGVTDEEAKQMIEELKSRVASAQREMEQAQKREREAIAKQRDMEQKLRDGDAEGALAVGQATTEASAVSELTAAAAAATVAGAGAGNPEEEARLAAEVAQHKALAAEQQDARKKAEQELASVKSQLATLEASASGSSKDLQEKLKSLSASLSTAEAALADTKEQLAAETASKAEAATQHGSVVAQLEALKAGLESERDTLTARVKELESQLQQRDAELQGKNDDLTGKIAQLAALEDEMRALRDQLAAKDVEMAEKTAAQEAAAAAALQEAHDKAAAEMAAAEAKAKEDLDAADAARAAAVQALDGEVQLKDAALQDASEKQTRIDGLNAEVDALTKKQAEMAVKYVEEQERRKHFQQEYEAAKGKIRVYARVRPFIRLEKESQNPQALVKCVHPADNVWTLLLNIQKNSLQENRLVDDWTPKTFDHIFLSGYEDQFGAGADNGSQAQVFKECEGFAEMAFDGLNTCIFAYGQSGSGKTWTMRGSVTDPEQFGLKPRMVRHVFEMKEKTKARYDTKISCSMFEIYNDEIQDIFERHEMVLKWEATNGKCYKCYDPGHSYNVCPNCAKCRGSGHSFSLCKSKQVGKFYLDRFQPPEKKLDVKVLGNQRVSIPGLQQRELGSFEEMQQLCDDAELLRRVRATGLNDESSRSHLIFAIYIEKKERNPKDKKKALPTFGKLSLCDLAGSEKVERTQMAADVSPADRKLMIEEGKRINASLSVLTSIFAALGAKLKPGEKRQLPRYRENLLTNCMQDSIGGNARTLMFVNVSPSLMNFEETKQTLSYGDLVQNITGTVATADVDVEQYIDRIAQLEEQLKKYRGGDAAEPAENTA